MNRKTKSLINNLLVFYVVLKVNSKQMTQFGLKLLKKFWHTGETVGKYDHF
jgi:hypothetical protein